MLPFTLLVKFDKENDKFEPVQNLESNDVQREAIADLQLPTVQNFVVPEDSGEDARSTNMLVVSLKLSVRFSLSLSHPPEGPSLNGKMMLPPGFNSKNKYPVLVYVYGGPNSQLVGHYVIHYATCRCGCIHHVCTVLVSSPCPTCALKYM